MPTPIDELFDLAPEFPVAVSVRSRGMRAPLAAGMVQRRRAFQSAGAHESAKLGEVRSWGLSFERQPLAERNRMILLRSLTGGAARTVRWFPPDVLAQTTIPSNSATSPEDFLDGAAWKAITSDTTVTRVVVAPPPEVGGTDSFMLENAGGASDPAGIRQSFQVFHRTGKNQRLSCFVRRPVSNPAARFTLSFAPPGLIPDDAHSGRFRWTGIAWLASQFGGGAAFAENVGGGWWRLSVRYTSGDGGSPDSSPSKRNIELGVGIPGNEDAGNSLYIIGAMVEELHQLGPTQTYTPLDQRVPVRFTTPGLGITRVSAAHFAWTVGLEEAI